MHITVVRVPQSRSFSKPHFEYDTCPSLPVVSEPFKALSVLQTEEKSNTVSDLRKLDLPKTLAGIETLNEITTGGLPVESPL
jgi:hypothetical protein